MLQTILKLAKATLAPKHHHKTIITRSHMKPNDDYSKVLSRAWPDHDPQLIEALRGYPEGSLPELRHVCNSNKFPRARGFVRVVY